MRRFKLSLILVLIVVLAAFVFTASAQEKTEVYNWKMVSGEVADMPMTVYAERFAELVEERSDGRIKIEVIPFGSLGGERDLLELVQMGQIELGSLDASWVGGFIPQVQVFALQYIFPEKNPVEVIAEVVKNGRSMQLLNEHYREKGLLCLGIWGHGWLYAISRDEMRSMEDFKGAKHRVMGNPLLIDAYNNYGFTAVTLEYGELYGAMQTKLIDSFTNSIASIYLMHFYEVGNYIINRYNEAFMASPIMNAELFDSLPEDLQKIIIDSGLDLVEPLTRWSYGDEERIIGEIKKAKPSINISVLSSEEIEPLRERAWQESGPANTYLKIGGEGAKEILDALLDDIKTAENKFQ